jgi:hypothetical protein
MRSSLPRGSGAGPLYVHSNGPSCSCNDCEMARRQQEVRDLLDRLDKPFSPALVWSNLSSFPIDAAVSLARATQRLFRRREDDEWDPY